MLDIANESRYDQYDLTIEKPQPLVPRALRFTVPERMDVHGNVRLPLDEAAVRALARKLEAAGIESVAIAFMHSYVNPAHERRTREILQRGAARHLWITLSSEVCPEIREYERTSTAVANAYVQPLMDGYLARMADGACSVEQFARRDLSRHLGRRPHRDRDGAALPGAARRIRSGRRRDFRGAGRGARAARARCCRFDMGGTTAKICLIDNYEPQTSRAVRGRSRRALPEGLRPAGAHPGDRDGRDRRRRRLDRAGRCAEARHGRPGERRRRARARPATAAAAGSPTVTDADVVLGTDRSRRLRRRHDQARPGRGKGAAGRATSASRSACRPKRRPMPCTRSSAENMANAARVHAVERGEVVDQHTLIAFGGAAPLHAARVAEKLGVRRVIVPPNAGVGSAVGFLAAPVAYELVRSRHVRLDDFDPAGVSELLAGDGDRGARRWSSRARAVRRCVERRAAYMRYVGQGHEITVELPNRRAGGGRSRRRCARSFEADYAAMFGRPIPGAAIEILSWSVLASDRGARCRRAVAAVARKPAGKAGRQPRSSSTAAAGGRDRDAGLSPRATWRRARDCRARRRSPRTRPRPSSPTVLPRISMRAGCIVMERKAA